MLTLSDKRLIRNLEKTEIKKGLSLGNRAYPYQKYSCTILGVGSGVPRGGAGGAWPPGASLGGAACRA